MVAFRSFVIVTIVIHHPTFWTIPVGLWRSWERA
jgi:hypothetical protein